MVEKKGRERKRERREKKPTKESVEIGVSPKKGGELAAMAKAA